MSTPFIVPDDDHSGSNESFSGSGSGEGSSEDSSMGSDDTSSSGTNSEEEPELVNAARQFKANQKRKDPPTAATKAAKKARIQAEEDEDEASTAVDSKATVAAATGMTRVIIPTAANTVDKLIFISPPAYTQFAVTGSGAYPGGQTATCILGPACVKSQNSNAQSTLSLPCLIDIRKAHPGQSFYAGHLINAQFGGPSTINNITALTGNANGAQKAFDNHIVNAVGHLRNVYLLLNGVGVNVMTLNYGIHITITMSATMWGAHHPNDCISQSMTCTAAVVNPPNVDSLVGAVYTNGVLPTGWAGNTGTRQQILNLMQLVQNEVATAHANGAGINNT